MQLLACANVNTTKLRGREKMLGHKDLLMQQLYYEESIRQAEKERLLRRILAERRSEGRRHHRAMGWLGSRLVDWGQGLQERYGAPVAAPR